MRVLFSYVFVCLYVRCFIFCICVCARGTLIKVWMMKGNLVRGQNETWKEIERNEEKQREWMNRPAKLRMLPGRGLGVTGTKWVGNRGFSDPTCSKWKSALPPGDVRLRFWLRIERALGRQGYPPSSISGVLRWIPCFEVKGQWREKFGREKRINGGKVKRE